MWPGGNPQDTFSLLSPMTLDRVTTALLAPPHIFAHRGFSARQPEMTLAAYQEAIRWAVAEGVQVGLECDVQLTADDELVCLHDQRLGRTARAGGRVRDWPLALLRELDFGSWRTPEPTPAQRSIVTLAELLALVHAARERGADVTAVIETKHFRERGLELEQRVCAMLAGYGWLAEGSPVRLITFSRPGAEQLARLAPAVDRTLLVERTLGPYADGSLPDGVRVLGVDLKLLRRDPGIVARAQSRGNEVHVWTVNEPGDIRLCRAVGVTGFTTDWPDRVLSVLGGQLAPAGPRSSLAA
jgi:glycerophosphoryl diester phosphodiesterase